MRRQEGSVVERPVKHGTSFALRFQAYGKPRYVTLGTDYENGLTTELAEIELANTLADVRRQLWVPPEQNRPPAQAPGVDVSGIPTLREFTSKKQAIRELEVEKRTAEHDDWALRLYLVPYFGDWRMSDFTQFDSIDDFRGYLSGLSHDRRKAIDAGDPLRDSNNNILRPLLPSTINRVIGKLASYLEFAVENDWVPRNIAQGRRRRLKVEQRRPVYIDTAQQVEALVVGAGKLDLTPRWRCTDRRAIVATLLLAGPRATELCQLLWRDIDFANRRISIGRSKTAAGLREIPMVPALYRELLLHKAQSDDTSPDALVFPTSSGRARNKDNLRERMLIPCLAVADKLLLADDQVPLPKGVSPHKLRHAFASIMIACGEDPARVQAWLGHEDPRFTMKVYTHMMARSPEERARLTQLVDGEFPASPEPERIKTPKFTTTSGDTVLVRMANTSTTTPEERITMPAKVTRNSGDSDDVLAAVKAHPDSTTAELADILDLARSVVGKHLNKLEDDNKIARTNSESGPDTWKKKRRDDRLKPGELRAQVRDYLDNADEPLGPVAIARALDRSTGAVSNCLKSMKRDLEAEVVQDHPLRYAPKTRVPVTS